MQKFTQGMKCSYAVQGNAKGIFIRSTLSFNCGRSQRRALSYGIDLKGKVKIETCECECPITHTRLQVAFIAGVADARGFGWATAKQMANAGATVIVGTWPPMLKKFEEALKQGFGDDAKLLDGSTLNIQKVRRINRHIIHLRVKVKEQSAS